MRAAVSTRYGPPDVVHVRDGVPEPGVRSSDLLVRVHTTTVNRTDCGYRAATPFVIRAFSGLRAPRVSTWGTEYAGVVESVGESVTAFAPGDRVFGYGESRFGAHAEYLSVDEASSVATIPQGVSFELAAAATEGGHYALSFIRSARIEPGQKVLVNGATGGIGSAAVQLLADVGVEVTAVCGAVHVDLVAGLGARRVVAYEREDFTRVGTDFDVVLDAVGKSSFGACRRLLRPGGRYLSSELGPWVQNPVLALATPVIGGVLYGGRRVQFPVPKENPEIVGFLAARLESGAFRPVIDRTYPLEDIVEAYRYVESGRKVGNVLVSVAAD